MIYGTRLASFQHRISANALTISPAFTLPSLPNISVRTTSPTLLDRRLYHDAIVEIGRSASVQPHEIIAVVGISQRYIAFAA
ncbi:hypothetical protein MY4824_004501 [Beauveria thailandica]